MRHEDEYSRYIELLHSAMELSSPLKEGGSARRRQSSSASFSTLSPTKKKSMKIRPIPDLSVSSNIDIIRQHVKKTSDSFRNDPKNGECIYYYYYFIIIRYEITSVG